MQRARIGQHGSVELTHADVSLVRAVSAAAKDLGLAADAAGLQTVQLAIAAADNTVVTPFWRAALAYEPLADGLADPLRRDPAVSFHQLVEPRPLRNRFHVWFAMSRGRRAPLALTADATRALRLPHDQAATRLDAAISSGGEVIRDEAPDGDHDFVALGIGKGSSQQPVRALARTS